MVCTVVFSDTCLVSAFFCDMWCVPQPLVTRGWYLPYFVTCGVYHSLLWHVVGICRFLWHMVYTAVFRDTWLVSAVFCDIWCVPQSLVTRGWYLPSFVTCGVYRSLLRNVVGIYRLLWHMVCTAVFSDTWLVSAVFRDMWCVPQSLVTRVWFLRLLWHVVCTAVF